MIRNLKALGLALTAMLAISAMTAAAAQATEEFLHSHKEKTVLTGEAHEGPARFELSPGSGLTVECESTKLEGTVVGVKHESAGKGTTYTTGSGSGAGAATFSGCSFAGHPATINTNECHLTIFGETTETKAGKPMGTVELTCPAGKSIEMSIPALGIVMRVGPQLIPHSGSYTNVNTGGKTETEEVIIVTTAGIEGSPGIAWTCTPKATCIAGIGANSGTSATLTGQITGKGFEDKNTGANEGKTGVYEEGAQTGIWLGPAE